jgi:hypothetical protein
MVALLANLLLAFSVSGTIRAGTHALIDRLADDGNVRVHVALRQSDSGDEDKADDESDSDSDLEVVPPRPPAGNKSLFRIQIDDNTSGDLPRFTETARNVSAVEVLHRIARTAGWSLTIVGVAKDLIDVDVKDADPRDAVRQVLTASRSMGVLHRGKLVVVPAPDANVAGTLVERVRPKDRRTRTPHNGHGRDMVRVFQGDLVVPAGTVVQGNVVNLGGSIELEPNSVVQGDTVSVLGSTTINEGAVVLGDAVAVLGEVDVERGGQVVGEHVQVGLGKMFRPARRHSFLGSLGPFGFFPTLALFAVVYLIGLLVLRVWPERVRQVGYALFEQPVKSFLVGFLCWLLLLPLVLLLIVSVVGIPLIFLLPVMIFLAITMGTSALALRVGEALPAGPGQRFVPPAAMGMGLLALLLLGFVPWLGASLLALLQFVALGAAVTSRMGRTLPPHMA